MKTLLKLALPTAALFLGQMLMGFVDLLFVGKLGAAALGGLGLGNSVFSWVMTIGIGLLFGLDFPTSHAFGAGDRRRAFRTFSQGLYLSVFLSVVAIVIVALISFFLPRFGLNAEAVPYAQLYIVTTAISYFPIFFYNAGRSYLQAQSIAVPTFVILVLANLLNLFLCAALIEGRFGFNAYGFKGVCYATVISRFFMAFALLAYVFRREARVRGVFDFSFDRLILKSVLRLGTPASAHMLLEVGVFSLATALAAKFTADQLAAHQIVLNTASLLFMIPMGIGAACAALVGQSIGANDPVRAKGYGNMGLALGLGFAVIASSTLILFADRALGIYTNDPSVIAISKGILFIAALFQISDGLQVIAAGALRGLGNTTWGAIWNGIGHWGVGLPLSLLLAFHYGWAVEGIWVGLAVGLTVVAVPLVWIWRREIGRRVTA
jgi:MATE family multidrug resistance protein